MKELIEKIIGTGLFSEYDRNEFTSHCCDWCKEGHLAGETYYMKGYTSLDEAKEDKDNYYEFRLCPDCLYKAYYGEEN